MTTTPKPIQQNFASFTKTWHKNLISPTRPELRVEGKTVVVTGGGTGIGKAIAKAFAEAGASSVAIVGRREDRLISAVAEIEEVIDNQKTKLLYEMVDLTKRNMTTQAMDKIMARQGGRPIDIFVSNAGATPKPSAVASIDDDEFMVLTNMNVRSTLNAVHAFISRASENAVLINVSTGLAHMLPRYGLSAHAASKAASLKLIEYVQSENPKLHVVSLQPASVKTEATQHVSVALPDDASLPGHFCVWLASDEAKFLKGKYVWGNWDVGELMARAEEIQSTRLLSVRLDGLDM